MIEVLRHGVAPRSLAAILPLTFALALHAQQKTDPSPPVPNVAGHRIQPSDLVNVQVYNAPEFTRVVRVANDGAVQIPLVESPIRATGLIASELEQRVAEALKRENLLLNPLVSVTVVEYASRPISVAGAVKNPITFQTAHPLPLLEALTRAGGLESEASGEILISKRPATFGEPVAVRKISTRKLLDEADPASNILLEGGEEIRVPTNARVFVFGNVRAPGGFPVQYNSQLTVLKALSLAGGVNSSTRDEAFIVRRDEFGNEQIPTVDLKRLIDREIPDMNLVPGDILYVVENKRRRMVLTALDRVLTFGTMVGAGVIVVAAGR